MYNPNKEKDTYGVSSAIDTSDRMSDDLQDPGHTEFDKRDMHRMGKKQELSRNFKIVTSIAFTSCVMGTWELLLATNTPGTPTVVSASAQPGS